MILTGAEILAARNAGDIVIDPFDETQINPNSYNMRLDKEMCVYVPSFEGIDRMADWLNHGQRFPAAMLDCKKDNPTWSFAIPEQGLVLYPGKLYLGATVERTESSVYVPMVDGRSSLARLGISVHQTGGFGDVGFRGHWTLEITCVEPVRIYAGMRVCQVRFEVPKGDTRIQYDQLPTSKYANQVGPTPSRLHTETQET